MRRKQHMMRHKTFYCKSTLNYRVQNIYGDGSGKDVCGEAVSIDAFDDPRQVEVDAVEKISLMQKDNLEAVLNSDSLSDE